MGDKKEIKYVLKVIYLTLRKLILKIAIRQKAIATINPSEINSIVALRIDRIGDVVVSLPALKALKELFPKSQVTVVVKESIVPLLKSATWIDEVIPYHGLKETAKILQYRRFDMAVDLLMDYSITTALIVYLSRAKVRVGFDIEARGRFFNLALKPSPEKKQMSKHTLDLIRLIARASGKDASSSKDFKPQLSLSKEDKAFAEKFFLNNGLKKGEIILGVHPGGWFSIQRWEVASFAELVKRLSKKFNARILVVGSSQEKGLLAQFIELMEIKPFTAIGFSLDKLAAVIAFTDIFIGNNSGLLHIAAALGKPTVSTMGPTDSYLWWPQGENQIVIRHPLDCSPCNKGYCEHHRCMKLISVDEMEKAVESLMEKIKK